MKSYMAHVSSWRLFRALNIEGNLARPVIIQIPTQSPGRYTAELPLRRIKLFFILFSPVHMFFLSVRDVIFTCSRVNDVTLRT